MRPIGYGHILRPQVRRTTTADKLASTPGNGFPRSDKGRGMHRPLKTNPETAMKVVLPKEITRWTSKPCSLSSSNSSMQERPCLPVLPRFRIFTDLCDPSQGSQLQECGIILAQNIDRSGGGSHAKPQGHEDGGRRICPLSSAVQRRLLYLDESIAAKCLATARIIVITVINYDN